MSDVDSTIIIAGIWGAAALFSLFMMFIVGPIYFKNTVNNYVANINEGGFSTFIAMMFGPIYFMAKNIWNVASVYLVFLIPMLYYADSTNQQSTTDLYILYVLFAITMSLWVVIPFYANPVLRAAYLEKGWVWVNKDGSPKQVS